MTSQNVGHLISEIPPVTLTPALLLAPSVALGLHSPSLGLSVPVCRMKVWVREAQGSTSPRGGVESPWVH